MSSTTPPVPLEHQNISTRRLPAGLLNKTPANKQRAAVDVSPTKKIQTRLCPGLVQATHDSCFISCSVSGLSSEKAAVTSSLPCSASSTSMVCCGCWGVVLVGDGTGLQEVDEQLEEDDGSLTFRPLCPLCAHFGMSVTVGEQPAHCE